jgi:uncharacterized protein YdeI (YjbR/CyaY-like superfamily)
MDVKDAVKRAKAYVAELFAEENLTNLGLEEVEYDDADGTWNITVGFSRPWNTTQSPLTTLTGEAVAKRVYRTVRIVDDTGQVLSVLRRSDPES